VCVMLCSLENYYWRYTSASELVNMILAFCGDKSTSADYGLFQVQDFLTLSESMVQMIMCRNLEVPEIRKFEAMLGWARHKIRSKTSSKLDAKLEFKCIMERLARDLKLYRISPQELIKIVLPSKAIKNERILETLMFQANSGMYRIQDSYLEACQQRLQKQDSRFSESPLFHARDPYANPPIPRQPLLMDPQRGDVSVLAETIAQAKSMLQSSSFRNDPVGMDEDIPYRGDTGALTDVIAQATSLIQQLAKGPAIEGSLLKSCLDLPPPQPLAPPGMETAERLFVVCTPKAPPPHIMTDLFSRFGNLIDMHILNGRNYGYVKYGSKESAQQAMQALHGQEMCGAVIKVKTADPPSDSSRKRVRTTDD
ncbi:hypothetical protein L9F63_009673, partial [Diploptera punctata]